MKRKPDSTDGISKIRKIPYQTTKKLGWSHKVNRNSKRSYEKTVWQEEMKSTRTKERGQYMVGG